MYTDFASVYDRLMADVPYREWAAYRAVPWPSAPAEQGA